MTSIMEDSQEPLLSINKLTKSFGGIIATDDITLNINRNEVHAIIGPNGAGKTTLMAQISGLVSQERGTIFFKGQNITYLPPYKRSQLGLARSFQITSIFRELSVIDNVSLAVQADSGHSYRFWHPANKDKKLIESALSTLHLVGLESQSYMQAGRISHGEQRLLEIAISLATNPALLLLDEPMAGMGIEEGVRMIEMLKTLKETKTLLFIEHDMDAVFQLAERVSVLVYGKIVASGPPDIITQDIHAQEAYLGENYHFFNEFKEC